ncbi:MAG: hypothetical protein KF819_36530 [Labilithrix sp.]|nr:hypothetical protein [Labilithrix sp.]
MPLRALRRSLLAPVLACAAGCVPADEALPLGGVEFTVIGPRTSTRVIPKEELEDGWEITVDRFVVSFKTMTIVNESDSEQCSYRGKGQTANEVFDAAGEGYLVQSFNGFKPGDCPDVGMRLGPPDDRTTLGVGASVDDLHALVLGRGGPAHALLEATARRRDPAGEERTLRLSLRFDTAQTGASFGGCRDAVRGARIHPEARYPVTVSFSARPFFRTSFSPTARLRFDPYTYADAAGDDDGVVTMAELDAIPAFYAMPPGATRSTMGAYVREQFRSTVAYGRGGLCFGLEPGFERRE